MTCKNTDDMKENDRDVREKAEKAEGWTIEQKRIKKSKA